MTKFATSSKAIRLALALTVLTPMQLFAETLTARQMLAEAQNKAVTLPGEAKKSGTIELAKVEPTRTEPTRFDLAPPMPVIAAPAPVMPVPAASVPTPPQSPVARESTPAVPTPDAAKPSVATITVPPAPIAAAAPVPAPVPVPIAAVTPVAAVPAIMPARENQARPALPAPATPVAAAVATEPAAAAPAATSPKTAHSLEAPTSNKAPKQKVATRRSHGSQSEAFNGGGSVNAQIISRIMQRPEVQSLIAQYGAQ